MKMQAKIVLAAFLLLLSCGRNYTPKPSGYVRVHYPEKQYTLFDEGAPFTFEYPVYAKVVPDPSKNSEPYWYNVVFPEYKATIHLSYKKVDHNVMDYISDSRDLVYKHTSRAEGIEELPYIDSAGNKYGIIYDLEGNVASEVQFFLTDSVEHFLRGALYFRTTPNRDSLNPVVQFVRQDIVHLVETVKWK